MSSSYGQHTYSPQLLTPPASASVYPKKFPYPAQLGLYMLNMANMNMSRPFPPTSDILIHNHLYRK